MDAAQEPVTFEDGEQTAKCPVPEWALKLLALALPLLAVVALVWFLFLR